MPRTLASPPAGVVEEPIQVRVQDFPALTPDANGYYRTDGTYAVAAAVLGVPHIFIDDIDMTYLRGKRTLIREWTLQEPGGETTAVIEFPQIYPFDSVGETGDELAHIGADRNCDIVIVEEGTTAGVYDGTQHEVWNGMLVSDETSTDPQTFKSVWHAKGLLTGQAMAQQHRVVNYMEPTDIGTVIPAALNAISSRRFDTIATVTTGIMTRTRGAESDKVWDYVQDLLATAWTDDGQQWTIRRSGPKAYEMVLKDNSTIHYQLEAGTKAVTANLSRDSSQKYNVIWGRAVGPNGAAWRGMVYPDYVTDLTYDPTDLSGLDGAFRYPLIFDPKVNDGSLVPTGVASVEYDAAVERQDIEINYPTGTTKDAAYLDAQRQLARDENAGMAGTISTRTDFVIPDTDPGPLNSRFLMQPGQNVSYRNFRGGDFSTDFAPFLLHVAQVRVSLQDHAVELTVDSRTRDAMTLSSIRARNLEAAIDPAKRPGNVNRRSRQEPDVVIEYDDEATGGIIATHTVTGSTWKVFPRPLSGSGRIVKIQYHCTGRYALMLFGAPVSPSYLDTNVGDLLASDALFKANQSTLEDDGLIEAWGKPGDALGYYPGTQANGDTFNGNFLTTNTIEFTSTHGEWVWVCERSESGTFDIDGRIYVDVNK